MRNGCYDIPPSLNAKIYGYEKTTFYICVHLKIFLVYFDDELRSP